MSGYWHVQPSTSRARVGAATSSGGSPGLRGDSIAGTPLAADASHSVDDLS